MMHRLNVKMLQAFISFKAKQARLAMYVLPMTSLVLALTSQASAQLPTRVVQGIDPLTPLSSEPQAKLVVDAPLPDQLARGRVVLLYRTENLRILPVYGPEALKLSPRVGHLHITVDDGPWRWIDASNEPLIINKLPPGPHRILIEMVDPTHQVIEGKTINFIVPVQK